MSLFRTAPVEELGVLVDGANYYRELYRAMLRARRSIVMSGWQFDSTVALVRGDDAKHAEAPVTLLELLKHLCATREGLQVWILAWDFHPILLLEREWMQKLVFDWNVPQRLSFLYDSNHAPRGCHHQKFVTLDGELSFLGGLDVAEDRWDERDHRLSNPLRTSRGAPHKPFHDVHTVGRGAEYARAINQLFLGRWERAGGEPVDPQALTPTGAFAQHEVRGALPLDVREVSLCRTDPHVFPGASGPCTEIRDTLVQGIRDAQRLIYVETQYFSSHAIAEALEARMRDAGRPTLDLVFVLNPEGETLKETIAMGLSQAALLERLRGVARETGHRLGFYVTVPHCALEETPDRTTYIHAKVTLIDDRWLCVGSANLNNRSMGVDTELNLLLQTDAPDSTLAAQLKALRCSLLSEHLGGAEVPEGPLVPALEALIDGHEKNACRLRRHPSPTDAEKTALALVDPTSLPFDPDRVEPQEPDALQQLAQAVRGLFDGAGDRG